MERPVSLFVAGVAVVAVIMTRDIALVVVTALIVAVDLLVMWNPREAASWGPLGGLRMGVPATPTILIRGGAWLFLLMVAAMSVAAALSR